MVNFNFSIFSTLSANLFCNSIGGNMIEKSSNSFALIFAIPTIFLALLYNSFFINSLFIKNNKNFDVDESRIDWYINRYNIDQKNVSIYNDIAFYLGEGHNYNSSLYILKKIIKIYPNRIVAYLNIADVYWEIGNKDHAKVYYQEYISRMDKIGKKSIIPKRVFQRVR